MEKKIGFIGAGNIAEALIRGLLETGVASSVNILASAPRAERAAELRKRFQIEVTGDNKSVAGRAEILVLAVKPQMLASVLSEICGAVSQETLIISVAAGIPSSRIEELLGGRRRVIRTMPNPPVVVQAGATALARGTHATAADLEVARTIFNAVGVTVDLDESLMDATHSHGFDPQEWSIDATE